MHICLKPYQTLLTSPGICPEAHLEPKALALCPLSGEHRFYISSVSRRGRKVGAAEGC